MTYTLQTRWLQYLDESWLVSATLWIFLSLASSLCDMCSCHDHAVVSSCTNLATNAVPQCRFPSFRRPVQPTGQVRQKPVHLQRIDHGILYIQCLYEYALSSTEQVLLMTCVNYSIFKAAGFDLLRMFKPQNVTRRTKCVFNCELPKFLATDRTLSFQRERNGWKEEEKSRIEARKAFMLCLNLMYRAGQNKVMCGQRSHSAWKV